MRKQAWYVITYTWHLKNWIQQQQQQQQKTDSQIKEQTSGYQQGDIGWRSKIVGGGFEVQSTVYKINNLQWCTV